MGRGPAGIAISPSRQIWTLNRGAVPVQVYTAEGALVNGLWGQGQFREPHQVRIDRKGFGSLFLVDSGLHRRETVHARGKGPPDAGNARPARCRLDPPEPTHRRGRHKPRAMFS